MQNPKRDVETLAVGSKAAFAITLLLYTAHSILSSLYGRLWVCFFVEWNCLLCTDLLLLTL